MRETEDEQNRVLLDIKRLVDKLELSILIIGAGARILIFDNQYNITGRATTDLDFAVRVNNWSELKALSTEMTQGDNPLFQATRVQHKFIHTLTNIEVDIVPFGAIGQPSQEIQWSDGIQMSVLGFDEAFHTAESRRIQDSEFKVVNLSGFLVLKLIAWNDKKARKHLEDIYFILEKYSDDDRVFAELIEELSQGLIEYEEATAFLLGRDIQNTFSQGTINKLQEILTQILQTRNSLFPDLISHRLDQDEWDAKFDTVVNRFESFKKGLNSTSLE
ncbi:MAG: nucleotidyl transferase AbiEii/AbiGii toxin family protein [Nostocaceae cyanobacterium]|nr:nucleotidyl transferase AbiEii/AbiGii toxin family protein [Nostocaceae cyanobacterium]